MKLLALDTATEGCSAALLDGARLTSRFEVLGRGHAERLLPMVDELLTEARLALGELDAIAFGRGPGAFTGVRIAIGVAQGLAFGAAVPLVPVSDLAALALQALERAGNERQLPSRVAVCLDARMGEVYWALGSRRADGGVELRAESLGTPERVAAALAADPGAGDALVGAGHGWSAYPVLRDWPGLKLAACWPEMLPRAAEIARLAALEAAAGRTVAPEQAEPVYLRNEVATRAGPRPAGDPRLRPPPDPSRKGA